MRIAAIVLATSLTAGTAVQADPFTDRVISEFQDLGFQRIEVENGPTQVKVEGIRGGSEYEIVYDRATGRILKQESGTASARDAGGGVSVSDSDRDFVGGGTQTADKKDSNNHAGRRGREDDDDEDYGEGN